MQCNFIDGLTRCFTFENAKIGIGSLRFQYYCTLQKLIHYLSINLRISSVVRPSFVFAALLAVEFGKFTI